MKIFYNSINTQTTGRNHKALLENSSRFSYAKYTVKTAKVIKYTFKIRKISHFITIGCIYPISSTTDMDIFFPDGTHMDKKQCRAELCKTVHNFLLIIIISHQKELLDSGSWLVTGMVDLPLT